MQISEKNGVPQCTLELYDSSYSDRHLVHGVLAKWAKEIPDATALIDAEDGRIVSWKDFDEATTALAVRLLSMGYTKGDVIVTSLPLLVEHIFLEYACFKIGVLFVPLDLRLKAPEVIRSINIVNAKAFACLGKVKIGGQEVDFGQLGFAVKDSCPSVRQLIQFCNPDDTVQGAQSIAVLLAEAKDLAYSEAQKTSHNSELLRKLEQTLSKIHENDECLAIFTTGSTGLPKPAVLSHRNITCQNMCLGYGFDMTHKEDKMLVNLPPSHVGCQTEQMMTVFYFGGTAVILHIFDPVKTLEAIQKFKVNCFGQIPAMFALEWRLPNYASFDLSSLKFVLYGGQAVTRQFLEQLSKMAPKFGTGLGLTECAGFCTYTPLNGTVDDVLSSLGYDMPVYPMSIRGPMKPDGSSGDKKPNGEIGEICFKGPQTFVAYANNEEAFKKTVSTDGWLYTGDVGFIDERGLHLSGRSKFIIKPKGYQVHPAQVEDALCQLKDKVVSAAVVGQPHEVFSEAIVAFVETKPGTTVEDLEKHMKAAVAAYMRPLHYVLLEPGGIPLNRIAKTDYLALKEIAAKEVEKLRQSGGWDR